MAVETQAEVLHALEQGDYEVVLGTAESEEIDFKARPTSSTLPDKTGSSQRTSPPSPIPAVD